MIGLSGRLQQAQLRRQAKAASSTANIAAAGTLLSGAGDIAPYV